ncbi:MAG: MASE1 domain-containing protein [Gammaproteobacteria bacterium]
MSVRLNGILLGAAYALAFWAARQISVDQWVLSAGVRVGALLLFAPRYWPYLMAGEYAVFAYLRYPLIEKFGLPWVVISSAVLMPTVAFIIHVHKDLIESGREYWLISVALLSAICVTALNLGCAYFLMPVAHDAVSWGGAFKYIVGDYLGILIFAPLVLLWKQRDRYLQIHHRVWIDALAAISVIALLTLYAGYLPDTGMMGKDSLRVLIIVPAIVLTCLHGWFGAAIGVAVLSLVIGLTMRSTGLPGSYDPNTFIVQEILAVAGTALLALGSTVSLHYHKFRHRDQLGQHVLALARGNLLTNEREIRERAARIKNLSDEIDNSFRGVVQWLHERGHHIVAKDVMRIGATQMQQLREELSLVYPMEIEHYGLYIVLQSSAIADIWEQTGRLAAPRLSGNPCLLSLDLQIAAYRSTCDAVSFLLEKEFGTIGINARCGRYRAQRGIVINVFLIDPTRNISPGTESRAMAALLGRVTAFGGTVRCRRNRIHICLREPE